jgi:dihydrofolate synthase / folylpolyglutamate synthase
VHFSMTYQETLRYLYEKLPAFQNVGKDAVRWKLENIKKLCAHFDNPQDKFKSIHIAGTNGKGSSSHYIASILQESGYKVGLYTSPHLKDFRERFRINGQLVDEQYVIEFVQVALPLIEKLKPSFFEITVVMAFKLFAESEIDIAVVEVGLGGRLDSTNIITPIACLITNIGFDHMDILGNTLSQIASEKAGIIKRGVPVVISEKHPETKGVFLEKAAMLSSPIFFAQEFYLVKKVEGNITNFIVNNKTNSSQFPLNSELNGIYQSKNLVGVLKTIDVLNTLGIEITSKARRQGISKVIKNTDLKGRWQQIVTEPLTICDTGHNNEAFDYLLKYLNSHNFKQIHLILGFSIDKEINSFLSSLPGQSSVYFSKFNSHRSRLDYNEYINSKNINTHSTVFENVNEAYSFVRSSSLPDDFIFIGGSTYLVAELNDL